ncbi:MAG TPA: CaiB/BaiF CoA-transferase family protein [Fulvivirga sp.]|nr:CaiB/BaiF CoA-transferase family protein [Fulvivirga sp.]
MAQSIFSNLKVLELASVLAGPSVGQFFAELGAEVIKVENPKQNGDVTRSWKIRGEEDGANSAYFSCVNWGKKSLTLDISKDEGLKVLYKLVSWADVVISSYKPGDDKKLKVDYQSLRKINDKLIYGQISGYGSDNDKVGYDAIVQAEAGYMSINGEKGSMPLKMPVALMDLLAGHQLKEAILLAYIKLLQSGEGSLVEVSLIDSALASLANQATNFLIANHEPQKQGSSHPNIAPYGEVYETKDNKLIILAVGNNQQFQTLCKILNIPFSAEYESNSKRVENRAKLMRILQHAIKPFGSSELMQLFNIHKVPAGIVNSVSEAIHTYGAKFGLYDQRQLKGIQTFVAKGIDRPKSTHFLPPPNLGEHSKHILSTILGLNESEIDELINLKIV